MNSVDAFVAHKKSQRCSDIKIRDADFKGYIHVSWKLPNGLIGANFLLDMDLTIGFKKHWR